MRSVANILMAVMVLWPMVAVSNDPMRDAEMMSFAEGVRVGVNLTQCLQTNEETAAAFAAYPKTNPSIVEQLYRIKDQIRHAADASQCEVFTKALMQE